MTAKNEYKVLIADFSSIVCEGLTALIKKGDKFCVVGQVDCMSRLMERLPYFRPDILIINPLLIDFSKRLLLTSVFESFPQLTIVALHYNYLENIVLNQYHGIISLEDNYQRIESALKAALQFTRKNKENYSNFELSNRETDVLIAVAKGMTNKDIADVLHISIHTVISHRKNITRKTGIKTVSGLTVYALLNHLIDQRDVQ